MCTKHVCCVNQHLLHHFKKDSPEFMKYNTIAKANCAKSKLESSTLPPKVGPTATGQPSSNSGSSSEDQPVCSFTSRLLAKDGDCPNEEEFAKTMMHAIGTTNKHYALEDNVKKSATVATYMTTMMTMNEENMAKTMSTTTGTITERGHSSTKNERELPTVQRIETPEVAKVEDWLTQVEVASNASTSSGRRNWRENEEQLFLSATRFLPREENLPKKQIVNAVDSHELAYELLAEHGGRFSVYIMIGDFAYS